MNVYFEHLLLASLAIASTACLLETSVNLTKTTANKRRISEKLNFFLEKLLKILQDVLRAVLGQNLNHRMREQN